MNVRNSTYALFHTTAYRVAIHHPC